MSHEIPFESDEVKIDQKRRKQDQKKTVSKPRKVDHKLKLFFPVIALKSTLIGRIESLSAKKV